MRFLGVGEYNDLGVMYQGLQNRGHEVRVHIQDPACHDVYRGMLERTQDWHAELPWVRDAGNEGVIIFESALRGEEQDELRRQGYQVIGGSALGDRLEADREFGQAMLHHAGLLTARSHTFHDYLDAISFLHNRSGRYVLKYNGADSPRTRNYIGELDDASDMIALLSMYAKRTGSTSPDFMLMEYVQGVEVGVGAYFNGHDFLEPACLDFEHKRFFPGELGELTGEMGTIVSYRRSKRLFDATLKPLRPALAESGYCGYINLNLIVNANGIWPLEFTSRFGYPGFAICERLHQEPWERIFSRMLSASDTKFATRTGFSAGIVLTVPPFPYKEGYAELSKGEPICLRPGTTAEHLAGLHFAEVEMSGNQLITSGCMGYVGVATGIGDTVESATANAYFTAACVVVPNLRYRLDIGQRVIKHDLRSLEQWGWLG